MPTEKLQEQIDDLSSKVEDLGKQENIDAVSIGDDLKNQLNFPLDPISKKVVKGILVFPISVWVRDVDAATAAQYGRFFTADRPYRVIAVTEVHGTAGTDGSAVTLQIERLQSTEALGSGDDLLTTAIDLKGTLNTVVFPSLVTNGNLLILARGDRLALKDAGTLDGLVDVQVTVYLRLI